MREERLSQQSISVARGFLVWLLGPAAVLVAILLSACAPIGEAGEAAGGESQLDWDHALANEVSVPNVSEAAQNLAFAPLGPLKELDSPKRILITAPERGIPRRDRAFALVYQDSTYGVFQVIEYITLWNQQDIEALTVCDPGQECDGRWSLVNIRNGIRAALKNGPSTTVLFWLEGGVTFEIIGPVASFSSDDAIAIANML